MHPSTALRTAAAGLAAALATVAVRHDVAADAATFVDHDVHLAPTFVPSPQRSLATSAGGTTGPVLGEAAAPTANRTGTYQLRVESPNLVLSNVDGFSVACA